MCLQQKQVLQVQVLSQAKKCGKNLPRCQVTNKCSSPSNLTYTQLCRQSQLVTQCKTVLGKSQHVKITISQHYNNNSQVHACSSKRQQCQTTALSSNVTERVCKKIGNAKNQNLRTKALDRQDGWILLLHDSVKNNSDKKQNEDDPPLVSLVSSRRLPILRGRRGQKWQPKKKGH